MMTLNEVDCLRIKKIVDEANKEQLENIKEWSKEIFETTVNVNTKINELKEDHIVPLKIKVYGGILSLGVLMTLIQVVLLFK